MTSFFRQISFILYGLRNFTKSAFVSHSASFSDDLSGLDLTGRVCCVSGANSGLGLHMAKDWVKRGAEVHMICRDATRGHAAREAILNECNAAGSPSASATASASVSASASAAARCVLHIVDLSSISSIKAFSSAFITGQRSLDVLVNNAGCMVHTRSLTAEGNETNFATNTLGTIALTQGLLPALRRQHATQALDPAAAACSSSPASLAFIAKVISVSSGGALTQDLLVDDLQSEHANPFDGTFCYAQQKRHQIVLTEMWQAAEQSRSANDSVGSREVVFHAMHPGWVDTEGVRSSMPEFHTRMKNQLRTLDQGIDSIQWLAFSQAANTPHTPSASVPPASPLPAGAFWFDRRLAADRLWAGRYNLHNTALKHHLVDRCQALIDRVQPTQAEIDRYAYLRS